MAKNTLRLKITGVDELRHAVKRYGGAVVCGAADAVAETVEATIAEARAAAPVGVYPAGWTDRQPGRLRDSIRGTVRTDGYSITGRVRVGVPYAATIEYGSERSKKVPFLSPAAIANRRKLNGKLRKVVIEHAPEGLGTPRITGEGPATPVMGID
jgi:hypothetical protein